MNTSLAKHSYFSIFQAVYKFVLNHDLINSLSATFKNLFYNELIFKLDFSLKQSKVNFSTYRHFKFHLLFPIDIINYFIINFTFSIVQTKIDSISLIRFDIFLYLFYLSIDILSPLDHLKDV